MLFITNCYFSYFHIDVIWLAMQDKNIFIRYVYLLCNAYKYAYDINQVFKTLHIDNCSNAFDSIFFHPFYFLNRALVPHPFSIVNKLSCKHVNIRNIFTNVITIFFIVALIPVSDVIFFLFFYLFVSCIQSKYSGNNCCETKNRFHFPNLIAHENNWYHCWNVIKHMDSVIFFSDW